MKTLISVLAITALMAMSALAAGNEVLRANIPFDFVVGSKHLPAGEYVFARATMPTALTITARDGDQAAFVLFQPAGDNKAGLENAIVFHTYGGTHFLKEVWRGENTPGIKLPTTKAEKEMISRMPVRTTIAASIGR